MKCEEEGVELELPSKIEIIVRLYKSTIRQRGMYGCEPWILNTKL